MLQSYTYRSGYTDGRRLPRLYLARGRELRRFAGEAIEGWCAIAAHEHHRLGWRSGTTWTILLAPGVRPLYFISPLHGTWGQHYRSWAEVARDLRLPVFVAQKVVRDEYRKTAERLDEVERMLAPYGGSEIEDPSIGWKDIAVFVRPRVDRRTKDDEYYAPQTARTHRGREVTIEPGVTEGGARTWFAPKVPAHARIVRNQRDASGAHIIEVSAP